MKFSKIKIFCTEAPSWFPKA